MGLWGKVELSGYTHHPFQAVRGRVGTSGHRALRHIGQQKLQLFKPFLQSLYLWLQTGKLFLDLAHLGHQPIHRLTARFRSADVLTSLVPLAAELFQLA
jgi:hypothetical protein